MISQGCCAKIVSVPDNPLWVMKRYKKKNKNKTVFYETNIIEWLTLHLLNFSFNTICIPKIRHSDDFSFEMQRVENVKYSFNSIEEFYTSDYYKKEYNKKAYLKELFIDLLVNHDLYLWDVEFLVDHEDRIWLIDFDKVGKVHSGVVKIPGLVSDDLSVSFVSDYLSSIPDYYDH